MRLLIGLGVAGLGALIAAGSTRLIRLVTLGGAAFLTVYAV
jgi:arginine exporter protein ArgO